MTPGQITGCIFAGALGDGWGRAFEGRAILAHINLPDALRVTDDTQMTLATCEAITDASRIDPEQIAAKFVEWFCGGKISGLGSATLKALRDLSAGAHWALSGAKGERAAGNGAAMRVAPLAFLIDPTDQRDRSVLRDVCRITHQNDEAYVGALAVVAAIRLVCQPEYRLNNLLHDVGRYLPDSQVRDRIFKLAELPEAESLSGVARRYGNSGFVVESVPFSLFAARAIRRKPLMQVLEEVIMVGGDTDTNASIAGQVAGAGLGIKEIPGEAISRLRDTHEIIRIAEEFATFAAA